MKIFFVWLLSIVLSACVVAFIGKLGKVPTVRSSFHLNVDQSSSPPDSSPSTPKVDDVISKVFELLSSKSGVDLNADEEGDVESLNNQFNKLITDMKKSSLTEMEKSIYFTEATLTMNTLKQNGKSSIALPRLEPSIPVSKLYSDSCAPYVCCYSSGKVGQRLKQAFKELGASVNVKYLDADILLGLPENELRFIVRGAKTLILASDTDIKSGKKGWFDSGSDGFTSSLNSVGLKKILNAALSEQSKSSDSHPIKVVVCAKGMKESKGLASLLGGDTFDLESETVLLCNQRNFGYSIVKVGNVVDDDAQITVEGSLFKRLRESITSKTPATTTKYPAQEAVEKAVLRRPFLVSTSRVDVTESTRVGVAVEGLLRMASYPLQNSTLSVISAPGESNVAPSSEEWDDELLRLVGPELHRIPLLYASPAQMNLKIVQVLRRLQEPGSGLITPISIEKYSNALRLVFTPKDSGYQSLREERQAELSTAAPVSTPAVKPGGYMSPEVENKLARDAKAQTEARAAETKKRADALKLEGGLEFFVDELPYKRVRIRRCCMGPRTIVKEESEALILKAVLNGIAILENDYRILLSSDISNK